MEKLVKIKELKNLWVSEKEDYRTNEVGTGVQNFVKKVLESTELFNLNEGKLKTKREKRKGEFIYSSEKYQDFSKYYGSIDISGEEGFQELLKQLHRIVNELLMSFALRTFDKYYYRYNEFKTKVLDIDKKIKQAAKSFSFICFLYSKRRRRDDLFNMHPRA